VSRAPDRARSPGTAPRRCEPCAGTGRVTRIREQDNVRFQTVTTCAECSGHGQFIDAPCETCGGRGEVAEHETLSVKIPVGVEEGMLLRVPRKGRPAPDSGGAPGDLFVAVHTRSDPRFERRGPHLWRSEAIELTDAVLGTTLRMPTLDGHAQLEVPAGTQPDTVLRMSGKGLPVYGGDSRGDLYVSLQVRIPEKLARDEKKLWERLRALRQTRKP
jgi:molecular chaperone DnaJ